MDTMTQGSIGVKSDRWAKDRLARASRIRQERESDRMRAEYDDAREAVAEGKASVRPTLDGSGLTPGERAVVQGAGNRAIANRPAPTGLDWANYDHARRLALRTVLLARPRATDPTNVKVEPVVIRIDNTVYAVLAIGAGNYRLTKPNGTAYDLERTTDGPVCDCPDYTFRCEGTGATCKHGRALIRVGCMQPAPTEPEFGTVDPAEFIRESRRRGESEAEGYEEENGVRPDADEQLFGHPIRHGRSAWRRVWAELSADGCPEHLHDACLSAFDDGYWDVPANL